jgi:8-oxo-dGTP pyrophosphatase MutT (NUDIX family)
VPARVGLSALRTICDKKNDAVITGTVTSAVLVLVFEKDGEATVVLTRRSAGLASDAGNISFPGGRMEPGESPLDAALRETREEIGLNVSVVDIEGSLPTVRRPFADHVVVPFLGILALRPPFVPNASEVDEILEVPLSELLRDGVAWEERWSIPQEGERTVHFFAHPAYLGENLIWGMTAMILWDLLDRATRST